MILKQVNLRPKEERRFQNKKNTGRIKNKKAFRTTQNHVKENAADTNSCWEETWVLF